MDARWVGALASVVSALATIVIALVVHHHSTRLAKLQTRQSINNELKGFNLAILTSTEFAEFLAKTRKHDVDFVRAATAVHFRMNILSDMFLAEREGIVPKAMTEYQFNEWVRFLTEMYPDALKYILSGETLVGHDPPFMEVFIAALPDKFVTGASMAKADLQRRFVKREHVAAPPPPPPPPPPAEADAVTPPDP
jgi:hypothetical protein